MKIEVSNGEIVDRFTILSLKLERIKDPAKLEHVRREYEELRIAMHQLGISTTDSDFRELLEVNSKLWDIENRIRAKEAAKEFDNEFISLARQVYITNDRRAAIKRRIDMTSHSRFVEEKEYQRYE